MKTYRIEIHHPDGRVEEADPSQFFTITRWCSDSLGCDNIRKEYQSADVLRCRFVEINAADRLSLADCMKRMKELIG